MHIAEGVLTGPAWPVAVATSALAAGAVAVGLRKMDLQRIPRVGLLSAAFFIASLIYVPLGPSSVHLLLSGLCGLLLGWTAFPALAAALLLQAVLFGFGGYSSLGANVLAMGLPAVVCYHLFAGGLRPDARPERVFALAFVAGAAAVALACAVTAAILWTAGREFIGLIVALAAGHVPVMVIDGFVTAFAVTMLHKVEPTLLCRRARAARAED